MLTPENREKAGRNRDSNGRFVKGTTGNPGGRPTRNEVAKDYLKAKTMPALELLVTTMEDPEAKPELRVRCAEILLDRALGKPTQPVDADIRAAVATIDELLMDEADAE